jgi:hypothetical protein
MMDGFLNIKCRPSSASKVDDRDGRTIHVVGGMVRAAHNRNGRTSDSDKERDVFQSFHREAFEKSFKLRGRIVRNEIQVQPLTSSLESSGSSYESTIRIWPCSPRLVN